MNNNKQVYVVIMNRWGDPNNHSYIKAVCSSLDNANNIANIEEQNRGGKYKACIMPFIIDEELNKEY